TEVPLNRLLPGLDVRMRGEHRLQPRDQTGCPIRARQIERGLAIELTAERVRLEQPPATTICENAVVAGLILFGTSLNIATELINVVTSSSLSVKELLDLDHRRSSRDINSSTRPIRDLLFQRWSIQLKLTAQQQKPY